MEFVFGSKFILYSGGLLAPCPTTKQEDHCLFNIFTVTLHSWRQFLHPQPEDAPLLWGQEPTCFVKGWKFFAVGYQIF
jgi:hypothetical protein